MNYRTARSLSKLFAYTGIGVMLLASLCLKSPAAMTLLIVIGVVLIVLNVIVCYFFLPLPVLR